MEEIKVEEYVRTKTGNIDKVDALYGMIENTVHLEKHKWQDIKNIVKHSPNIIDLIEEGDYVNGYYVEKVWEQVNYRMAIDLRGSTLGLNDENCIKSIVTKEMFNQVKYEV